MSTRANRAVSGTLLTSLDAVRRLPVRNDFLDTASYASARQTLLRGDPFEFLPVSLVDTYYPMVKGQVSAEKYAKQVYKLALFGVMRSGEKITVVLGDIEPYFEVRVPETETVEYHTDVFAEICAGNTPIDNTHPTRFAVVQGLGFNGYDDRATYIQIYFKSLRTRRMALSRIHKYQPYKYETAHDDNNDYGNVVCRDHMCSLTSWSTVSNYTVSYTHPMFSSGLVIDISMSSANYKPFAGDVFEHAELKNDRAVTCVYDIETYDEVVDGDVPQPEVGTCEMFLIGMSFVFTDSAVYPSETQDSDPYPRPAGYIANFAVTNIAPALLRAMPNRCIVSVKNESQVIEAFATIVGKFKPEYLIDFNGSAYDMKWIVRRACRYGLLNLMERLMSMQNIDAYAAGSPYTVNNPMTMDDFRYKFPEMEMKLSATDNMKGNLLAFPGLVHMDSMMQLRKLAANPQRYSLNTFLKIYGIGSKVDMPYRRMFAIYDLSKRVARELKNGTLASDARVELGARVSSELPEVCALDNAQLVEWLQLSLCQVIEYCVVDGIRVQDLMVRTSFIRDKRALGALAFVKFDSCLHRAGGMKVLNTTIAHASQRGVRISTRVKSTPEGQYPGAYVFHPRKGLVAPRASMHELAAIDPAWRALAPEDLARCTSWVREHGIHPVPEHTAAHLPECFTRWLRLEHQYPVAGLDFASLYPSIIMAFNMSPEKLVYSLDKVVELRARGMDTFPINFEFLGTPVKAWTVRHKYTPGCDYQHSDSNFGLFPSILLGMFNSRKAIKREMKIYSESIEQLESLSAEEYALAMHDNEENAFRLKYLDGKQKALKELMNTFYGVTGSARSSLRVIEIAGGITSTAQDFIKRASVHISELGCSLYYGDTDSSYNSMPAATFTQIDRAYYSGEMREYARGELARYRLELDHEEYEKRFAFFHAGIPDTTTDRELYAEFVIYDSFVAIKRVAASVNAFLERESKGMFLNMAYEEMLFPVMFAGKKKYAGIAHEEIYNRAPKKIFKRGLEQVKSSASSLLIRVSNNVLWKIFDINNQQPVIDVVHDQIEMVYTSKHDQSEFVLSATYRPLKHHVPNLRFAGRMREINREPTPGSRFSYVIVKKYPFTYNLQGLKTSIGVGDRMEYVDRQISENMEIDLDYYMGSQITSELARFISYHEDFQYSNDGSESSRELAEKRGVTAATKHVKNYCSQYTVSYVCKGPLLKSMWSAQNKEFQKQINAMSGTKLLSIYPKYAKARADDLETPESRNTKNWRVASATVYDKLIEDADREANEQSTITTTQFMQLYGTENPARVVNGRKIKRQPGSIQHVMRLRDLYKHILVTRIALYNARKPLITGKLKMQMTTLEQLFAMRERVMSTCMSEMHTHVELATAVDATMLTASVQNYSKVSDNLIALNMNTSITAHVNSEHLHAMEHVNKFYNDYYTNTKFMYDAKFILRALQHECDAKSGDVLGVARAPGLGTVADYHSYLADKQKSGR